jgi:hypothetical protein
MKIPFKKTLTLSLCVICFFSLSKGISKKTHSFSYSNFFVTPPKDFSIQFENPENLDQLVDQTFTFLGFGGESLVFLSQDKNYVLKVFKKHRIHPAFYLKPLRFIPQVNDFLKMRFVRYMRFWTSLKVQAEDLKQEAGLLCVHMPDGEKGLKTTLIDAIGCAHPIKLDGVTFVLQKKASLFRDTYLKETSSEKREQMLIALVNLYKDLTSKGYKIWDNSISRNVGLLDGKAFLIDAGSVAKLPENESIKQSFKHLKIWVDKYDPDKNDFIKSLQEEIY